MYDYKIAVGPWLSGPVQELTFFQSWTIDRNLDDGCTFSFSVPGDSPEALQISELDTDVWVYLNGVLNDRFRIIQVNQTWGPSGEDTISVQAVCYRRLLAARYVVSALRFDQISQGEIIWELINHTQSQPTGSLGITVGDLGPSVLRDRSYDVGQNILDAIVDLTNVIDGPTWDIDENLQLIVSQANLFPVNPVPIVLGATAQALSRPSGAAKFANVAVVSGNNDQTLPIVEALWTLPFDSRGRWERRAAYPSVIFQNTLQDHADGLVSDYQAAVTIWQVDVVPDRFFGDAGYKLGDLVTLIQPSTTVATIGTPAVEVDGQIIAVQIQQDANGAMNVQMRVLEIAGTPPEPPTPPEPEVVVVGALSDVTADGYRTVVWDSTGTLVVSEAPLNVEYMVIAGGGGGGAGTTTLFDPSETRYYPGGGGGAGGLLHNIGAPLFTIPENLYTVTVGAGGVGGDWDNIISNGTNSSVGSLLIAIGGGSGTSSLRFGGWERRAYSGGSGGGSGGQREDSTRLGGAGTINQGLKGGDCGYNKSAGGGGGRMSAGGNGTTTSAGAGGTGFTTDITGTTGTYASGGGGGRMSGHTGGTATGGGGAGGVYGSPGSNATGYGNGGGGGGPSSVVNTPTKGGDGSPGLVVLRWAV